ncbi:MAG: TonB-dependent receptor, partial [Pseudomonadota bacterium]
MRGVRTRNPKQLKNLDRVAFWVLLVVGSPLQAIAADEAPLLDEMVVTAQKREQPLQDVGIAVSAFSADEIDRLDFRDATDVAIFSPGVSLAGSFAGQFLTFSIRGVTQNDFLDHTEAPTAVYIDDGYVAAMNGQSLTLFDVERIEVLKGPQGTLFGRNATGGAVNVIAKKPKFNGLDGSVELGYGAYNDRRLEAALGGPVSERVAVRLAVLYEGNDDFYDNAFPGGGDLGRLDRGAVRAQILFKPVDATDILLTGFGGYGEMSMGPYQSRSTRDVVVGGNVVNSIVVDAPTLVGTIDPDGRGKTLLHDTTSRDNTIEMYGGAVRLDHDFGNVAFTSLSDYKTFSKDLSLDADATEVWIFNSFAEADIDNFSQELRLVGTAAALDWTVGGQYLHIDAAVPATGLILPTIAVVDAFRLKTDSYSAFGQIEYHATPRISLVGGLRVTREDKDFEYSSSLFAPGADRLFDSGAANFGPARAPISDAGGDTLITAKAQIEYRPGDGMLIYAGFNRGVKAGSFNAPFAGGMIFADSEVPYDEEILHAYEIGLKSTFVGGRARLNATAFYYDYQDYQAFKLIGLSTQVVNNDARTYGAEVEFDLAATENFAFHFTGSFLDTKVKDVEFGGLVADKEATFAPDVQLSAIARYDVAVGSRYALSVQGEAVYTGRSFYSLSNFDSTEEDGYALGNLRVFLSPNDSNWEFGGFVENLWNEEYITVGFDLSSACGCSETAYGRPTIAGVR